MLPGAQRQGNSGDIVRNIAELKRRCCVRSIIICRALSRVRRLIQHNIDWQNLCIHRDSQRRRGRGVAGVIGHLHADAVVAVRQFRGGKGPLALSLHGVIGGAVDKNLHLRHIRIDIPQRKGRRGVVRDVVAVEAAAV